MNARLAGNILYPLHERFFGRPTFRLLAHLERTQWYSPDDLRRLQAHKLRKLIARFRASVPRYAAATHVCDARDDWGDPFRVLADLPLSDKPSLRRWRSEARSGRFGRRARTMQTGGSTGEPLTFWADRTRLAYDKAARMRAYRWFGVEPGDKEACLWGAPVANRKQGPLRELRDRLLNDLLLSAFELSPQTMRRYLRRLEEFSPVCLFGYPSSLVLLTEFAEADGIAVRLPRLRAVFVTGEVLDAEQRVMLESYFGVPVADGYGGRDSGFCAHQCPHGGMHVTSEHIIMEIVDAKGRPVNAGEKGEIVVTNLDNHATPFIRYRTGDIGRLADAPCPCGRGLEIMDVIAGRKTDHLVASDGTYRHALSLIYKLRANDGIARFQVRQAVDRSVEVRVAVRSGVKLDRKRVLEDVRECIGPDVPAELRVVDGIGFESSGKFRQVVSQAVQ